jgi:hypothetical protein
MRILSIVLIAFLALACAGFIGMYVYVDSYGKPLLEQKLTEIFGRPVSVDRVRARFPFDLVIKRIDIPGLGKVEKVFASGGLIDVLSGDLVLNQLRLSGVDLKIESMADAAGQPGGGQAGALHGEGAGAGMPGKLSIPNIEIKRLLVTDSRVTLVDHKISQPPITLLIKDVNASFENLSLPVKNRVVTSFSIRGLFPWKDSSEQGSLKLSGWVNLYKKDMRATFAVTDIDAVNLYPYYASWIKLDQERIQKAKLSFRSEITGINNEVESDCHLELTQVVFAPRPEDQPEERSEKIAVAVLDLLKALNQGKIAIDFKFKTRMDSPEFGLSKLISAEVFDKVRQSRQGQGLTAEKAVTLPVRIVGEAVGSASDLTKSVINGTISVGAELKKALEAAFRRAPVPAADSSK